VTDRCPYGECDGSGFVVDESSNTAWPCRCRPQRLAQARARKLSGRIPKLYRDVGFERNPVVDMDPATVSTVRRFADDIDRNLSEGRGLWILGDVGTGKTTLAMLVSKAALEAGRSVAIYSLPRLLVELGKAVRDEAQFPYLEFLDHLAAVDLLHIDDLGYKGDSTWMVEQLFTIVNTRYEEQRSMLVTSTVEPVDEAEEQQGEGRSNAISLNTQRNRPRATSLEEQLGDKTVSRLREMCLELPLFGHDRRETFAPVD
jgi:DNA replication protein DnaC